MKKLSALLLLACWAMITHAQQLTNSTIPETREIILNYSDTIQKIRIFVINPVVKIKHHRMYAWYQKNTVLHTQGAWSGKLLHDKCESFYPNSNLLEQGSYDQGWKVGDWKKWYSDGSLKEKTTWKKGLMHGEITLYDPTGTLLESGTYVKGKRHGFYCTWKDGNTLKEKYRKGTLVVKKKKKEKTPRDSTKIKINEKKSTTKIEKKPKKTKQKKTPTLSKKEQKKAIETEKKKD